MLLPLVVAASIAAALRWNDAVRLVDTVGNVGLPYRSLVLFLAAVLLAVQVLIPPLPGSFLVASVAAAFGFWPAVAAGLAGIWLGSLGAFWLARTYGPPLVRQVVPDSLRDRAERLFITHGEYFLIGGFLLPYTADDALCYVAGALRFDARRFFVSVLVGRSPGVILWAAGGVAVMQLPPETALTILAAIVLLFGLGVVTRRSIRRKKREPRIP